MTRPLRWRIALAILAAVAASLVFMLASERWGRLAYDLQYDDVAYALDGAERLDTLRQGGLGALAQGLYRAPPHSPMSSLQALAAFALLGTHDIALYASNLWLLLALAVMVVAATRHASNAGFGVALAFTLVSPPAYAALAEFRPDLALGLVTCAMVVAFVGASLEDRPTLARWAGVLLGIALLVKPTFFAHTLAIAFALCALSLAGSFRTAPAAIRSFALPRREIAAFIAIGIALALPYFATGGKQVILYFWANTQGPEASTWNLRSGLGWAQVVAEFEPHLFALPRYHLGTAIAVALLATAYLAWRGLRREALQVVALLAVGSLSAAIIIAGRHPGPYFFAAMDWLFIFAAVTGYAGCDAALDRRRRRWIAVVLAAGLVPLFIANVHVGLPGIFRDESRHDRSRSERIVDAIRRDLPADAAARGTPVLVLVATAAGAVNPTTLHWAARSRGLPIVAPEMVLTHDYRALRITAAESDYLVLPQPAVDELDKRLPIGGFAPAFRERDATNPAFARIGGDDIAPYILLANRERLGRLGRAWIPTVDGGVLRTTGLGGAAWYPSRPVLEREVRIAFALPVGRPVTVHLRYASQMDGRLTLEVPGGSRSTSELRRDTKGELVARFTPFILENDVTLSITGGSGAPQLDITSLGVKGD